MMEIRNTVFANLNHAFEGGCFEPGGYLDGYSAWDIAHDMVCYAENVERLEIEQVLPHVNDWLTLKCELINAIKSL